MRRVWAHPGAGARGQAGSVGEPAVKAEDWTQEDREACARLTRVYMADEGLNFNTAHQHAYRTHFALTGRVPSHSTTGYKAGCRCRPCTAAATASTVASRRKARGR